MKKYMFFSICVVISLAVVLVTLWNYSWQVWVMFAIVFPYEFCHWHTVGVMNKQAVGNTQLTKSEIFVKRLFAL